METQKRKKINIAVFYGGNSREHEVSIQSAKNIINELKKKDEINVIQIFIDRDGKWYKKDIEDNKKEPIIYNFSKKEFIINNEILKIDLAFSIIHGNIGEDGKLQGFFEIINIPYAGCDVLSSAISMNKKISKILVKNAGIPVLKDITFSSEEFNKNRRKIIENIKKIGLPVFVKPISLGSSVGVSKVKKISELDKAIKKAFEYEDNIMVEKGIEKAREIVCGIMGKTTSPIASPCGEIVIKGKHEFYDYEAKYLDENGMELIIPAAINIKTTQKIQQYSKKIFKTLSCYGFARVDFLMDPKNSKIYFCEINTIPGFTSHSLFPRLFEKASIPLKEQLQKISVAAIERYNKMQEKNKKYEANKN